MDGRVFGEQIDFPYLELRAFKCGVKSDAPSRHSQNDEKMLTGHRRRCHRKSTCLDDLRSFSGADRVVCLTLTMLEVDFHK